MEVEQGKTYLMRIINAALNDELSFAIAGHNMTVVEVDVTLSETVCTVMEHLLPEIVKMRLQDFSFEDKIWLAAIEELMSQGMHNAEQALLSGCSAGGLASILHCDEFQNLLPKSCKVKCRSDAGFFLDAIDVSGGRTLRNLFGGVVQLQEIQKNLPKNCLNKLDPTSCFFPQNLVEHVETPLFLLNTAYDVWQLVSNSAPPRLQKSIVDTSKCKTVPSLGNSNIDILADDVEESHLSRYKEARRSSSNSCDRLFSTTKEDSASRSMSTKTDNYHSLPSKMELLYLDPKETLYLKSMPKLERSLEVMALLIFIILLPYYSYSTNYYNSHLLPLLKFLHLPLSDLLSKELENGDHL
ncbi:hypothetical protein KIW84_035155 [Lathyrus oleraceus]|uniref:Pectin acetylesterase n=1 Tax=Pisum sativum TaxID=3888 RepID=A0A9D4Y5F3_PEA|nr:hypothetical protein KIW84_035155 [Pisum sativum]